MQKNAVLSHITKCLGQLVVKSDLSVFLLYDPADIHHIEPIDYKVANPQTGFADFPNNMSFNGIGVWYIFTYNGDVFSSVKILAYMQDGVFVKGQVGDFEGYREDIEDYIGNDSWVQPIIAQNVLRQVPQEMAMQ